jgi:hypothetical protein
MRKPRVNNLTPRGDTSELMHRIQAISLVSSQPQTVDGLSLTDTRVLVR